MPTCSKILMYSLVLMLNTLLFACSSDEPDGPTISDIPVYPNSVQGESMQQSMLGQIAGAIQQYSTDDDFGQVLDFYQSNLAQYTPATITHELESGRQSALSIKQKNGGITITIQEYTDKGKVIITFMEVKRER